MAKYCKMCLQTAADHGEGCDVGELTARAYAAWERSRVSLAGIVREDGVPLVDLLPPFDN